MFKAFFPFLMDNCIFLGEQLMAVLLLENFINFIINLYEKQDQKFKTTKINVLFSIKHLLLYILFNLYEIHITNY